MKESHFCLGPGPVENSDLLSTVHVEMMETIQQHQFPMSQASPCTSNTLTTSWVLLGGYLCMHAARLKLAGPQGQESPTKSSWTQSVLASNSPVTGVSLPQPLVLSPSAH